MKDRLKFSAQVNRQEALLQINKLLSKVEEGVITLETDNKKMEFNLPENLTLNIKTEKNDAKDMKRKITVQLKWYEDKSSSKSDSLKIS